MAQTDHDEWEVGQKCEVFDEFKEEWVPGEINKIITNKNGKRFLVIGDPEKILHEHSENIRALNAPNSANKDTKKMMIQKAADRLGADLTVSKQKVYEFLKELYDKSHEDGMDHKFMSFREIGIYLNRLLCSQIR